MLRLLYPVRRNLRYPLDGRKSAPQSRFGRFGKKESRLLLPRTEPQSVQPVEGEHRRIVA